METATPTGSNRWRAFAVLKGSPVNTLQQYTTASPKTVGVVGELNAAIPTESGTANVERVEARAT